MAETREFAHGGYGDYAGINFYAPAIGEAPPDFLAISEFYFDALVNAVLARSWQGPERWTMPKLANEWNEGRGWAVLRAPSTIAAKDALELATSFASLTENDLSSEIPEGASVVDYVRCAQAIAAFLNKIAAPGSPVKVERD